VCENCSYLRIGTGNVEFAGLFAPKPLGMSGADDWTKNIERRGLPELKLLYRLYEQPEKVMAKCFKEFGHNYNQVSRELMYNWMNRHLDLKQPSPVEEKPFEPVPPAELSVYDEQHPRPADSVNAEKLRDYMTSVSDKQISALLPADATGPTEHRRILGTALRVMAGGGLPAASEIESKEQGTPRLEGANVLGYVLGRKKQGEAVPAVLVRGKAFSGTMVVWIDPAGKASIAEAGKLTPAAKAVLDKGAAILAVDVMGTGELARENLAISSTFAGYTFGYNSPLVAQRIHDILTAVAFARSLDGVKKVHLMGSGKAGPWVALARGLCGDAVARTAADWNRFRYDSVRRVNDEMMLPGAIKYGGLPALASLAAPGELYMHNYQGTGSGPWMKGAYKAAGASDKLTRSSAKVEAEKVVEWLLR
jgi:hypothetical protein